MTMFIRIATRAQAGSKAYVSERQYYDDVRMSVAHSRCNLSHSNNLIIWRLGANAIELKTGTRELFNH